jgi:hypothetical protein
MLATKGNVLGPLSTTDEVCVCLNYHGRHAPGVNVGGNLDLEPGEGVTILSCSHCGKELKSVCGFITRDGDAYSAYFAVLHTGHEEIVARLTISIGKWWDDDALDERHWVEMTVRPSKSEFNMQFVEPEVSRHANFEQLGIPLSRAEALIDSLRDEFFDVADYVVDHDPAVNSYLLGRALNISRNRSED